MIQLAHTCKDPHFLPHKIIFTGAADLTQTSLGAVIQLTTHAAYIKYNPYTYDRSFLCEYITRDGRCAGSPSMLPLLSTHAPFPKVFVDPLPYPLTVLRGRRWFPASDMRTFRDPIPGFLRRPHTFAHTLPHQGSEAVERMLGQVTGPPPAPHATPGRTHRCPRCPSRGGVMAGARPMSYRLLCLGVPIRKKTL